MNLNARLNLTLCTGLVAATFALPAAAGPILATSYAMPNGDGQASGGTYNYWDRNYNGSGSTTTDGAALSGGLGKLTDGFASSSPWYQVSNVAGTGEYVGWRRGSNQDSVFPAITTDPAITFTFAGTPTIDGVTIYLDNTEVGGVGTPTSILINGVARSFTAPSPGTVGPVNFTGLGLTGGTLTIQFVQQVALPWVFVSEVVFDGTPGRQTPEPGVLALLAAGVLAAGLAGRRLRRRP